MIELGGTITTISQMHIGSGNARGTFTPTLKHIPGRTIRGMLGYYLYENNKQLYDEIGIEEDNPETKGIHFKNAYPVYEEGITVAAPLAFKWCKKCGTQFSKNQKECKNIENNKQCLHEGKKHTGLIPYKYILNKKIGTIIEHSLQITTKCPITRNGHTSMPEKYTLKPYHIESIPTGTKFNFKLLIKEEFTEDIIEALKTAGTFYGVGGFRSRGYGSIKFDITTKVDLEAKIRQRAEEISQMESKLLVANSQIILQKDNNSIIGFEDVFETYINKTLQNHNIKDSIKIEQDSAKITPGIARGWSLKNKNTLSELIPCLGTGSCINVSGNPKALATLETYGIGEKTDWGYGDVYITRGVE